MSIIPKVYAALLKLAATGEPIASERIPLQEGEPGSAQESVGNGYEFKRTILVADARLPGPVEVETSLFVIKTQETTLLLCTLGTWMGPQGQHHTCARFNVTPEVVLEVVQRVQDDRMDSALTIWDKRMYASVYGQPHAKALQSFPYEPEYRRLVEAEIEAGKGAGAESDEEVLSDEDAVLIANWEVAFDHHSLIIEHLQKNAQLNMLCDSRPSLIEAHTLGAILAWARRQPEVAGRF